MNREDVRIRFESMLRRAGLSETPRPVLVCVGFLCVLLVVLALVRFWPTGGLSGDFSTTAGQEQAVGETQALSAGSAAVDSSAAVSAGQSSDAGIMVDVEGAVREPGVYELEADARVGEAIEAAGGFGRKAARTSVNLAQKLSDGQQVYVRTKEENAATGGEQGTVASDPGSSSSEQATTGNKVNLNTASAEELQTLSGIGPALSQRIIDYRETNGGFASVEELKEVSGIGDKRFAELEDSVCV